MATLQRFKFLATQCATAAAPSPAASPSASPAKSPAFHLRRHRRSRRTLRRLLSLSPSSPDRSSSSPSTAPSSPDPRDEQGPLLRHTSLKDLFVSSPEAAPTALAGGGGCDARPPSPVGMWRIAGVSGRGVGRFRYRILRRAWRPVLVTIPE